MSTRVQMTRANGEVFVDFVADETPEQIRVILAECTKHNALFRVDTDAKTAEYVNLALVQRIRLTEVS